MSVERSVLAMRASLVGPAAPPAQYEIDGAAAREHGAHARALRDHVVPAHAPGGASSDAAEPAAGKAEVALRLPQTVGTEVEHHTGRSREAGPVEEHAGAGLLGLDERE